MSLEVVDTMKEKKANGSCFLGQERSADVRINATRDNNNVRNVLQNTHKKQTA
jgi:hypothetical protein